MSLQTHKASNVALWTMGTAAAATAVVSACYWMWHHDPKHIFTGYGSSMCPYSGAHAGVSHGPCPMGSHKGDKMKIRPVPKTEKRAFSLVELQRFDGVQQPEIYISVKGVVYEVGPQHYGPEANYHVFAGHEVGRALAKSRVDGRHLNKNWAIGLTCEEEETLAQWVHKFENKYPVVGWLAPKDEDAYDDVE